MNGRTAALAAAAALGLAAVARAGLPGAPPTAAEVLASWPQASLTLARVALQKYGLPDEALPERLVWRGRRPWRRIVVFRDPAAEDRPALLLESVAYQVPVRRWRELAAFDRGVSFDVVRGELAARTSNEASNVLALNLADAVARGRLRGAQAAVLFDRTLGLAPGALPARWTRRLLFRPGR